MKIIAALFAGLLSLSHISLALPLMESEINSGVPASVNSSVVETRRDITESRGLFSELPVAGNLLQAATELPFVGGLVGDIAHSLNIL